MSPGLDRAHLDIGLAEAKVEEPIGEAPAVADRSLAQASLATEIVLVVTSQGGVGEIPCRRRRRRLRHAERREIADKAPDDEGGILLSVAAPVRA